MNANFDQLHRITTLFYDKIEWM